MKLGILSAALAAILAVGAPSASKAAYTTDLSDIWWNTSQSGMGYQITQNNDFLFVTFYVFGPDNKPLWYVAQLTHTGNFVFTGDVYYGNGPSFAGATYDPSTVTRTKVGTATFTAQLINQGTLAYSISQNIGGTTFSKNASTTITRLTLKNENFTGQYIGGYSINSTNCNPASLNGVFNAVGDLVVNHNGNNITMTTNASGTVCTYTGTYGQDGKLGHATGNFTCGGGASSGTFTFFEMEHRWNGFSLRVAGQNQYCQFTGNAAGIVQAQ